MSKKAKLIVTAVLLTGVILTDRLCAGCMFTSLWFVRLALYLVPYLLIGFPVLKEAAEGIVHGDLLDENS